MQKIPTPPIAVLAVVPLLGAIGTPAKAGCKVMEMERSYAPRRAMVRGKLTQEFHGRNALAKKLCAACACMLCG
jgi:hypothetical protein